MSNTVNPQEAPTGLMAVEFTSCNACALNRMPKCVSGACFAKNRLDHQDVHFIKATKPVAVVRQDPPKPAAAPVAPAVAAPIAVAQPVVVQPIPVDAPRYHDTPTQKAFRALSERWLTGEQALREFGLQTLGQRVSRWTSEGHTFDKRWETSPIGAKCIAYRLIKAKKDNK